jgi:hypothetical protein
MGSSLLTTPPAARTASAARAALCASTMYICDCAGATHDAATKEPQTTTDIESHDGFVLVMIIRVVKERQWTFDGVH